ncbi:PREDICTED: glycerol-3-phosphate acyltransferase, chloroplastic isoform X2 [Fragaria vesca subsp. vesca]|uniref:glycerol-3-phosphate acyltransferase, chloroplastic isoform X2 n=1 Tax=Fragaria vesca subsp. vesca TaxID=101020 RepID=UPI0002C2DD33|nr:PREDICTED: glycerol-3-phosphate acyltransferase, chloroplastic isoform X2 [Fragaria vesca subsp. vesca]
MYILSATFSSTTFLKPRVSSSSSSSSVSSSSSSLSSASSTRLRLVPLRSSSRRSNSACPCSFYSASKVRAMAEMVKDKEEKEESLSAVESAQRRETRHSRTFLNVTSEAELLSAIRLETEAGRLPANIASGMEELYWNYKNAILQSGSPKADEIVLSNMTAALDRIFLDIEDPFVFSPYHKALREPFDYYMFGQNYIRPLVDFRNSYVGNISIFYDMEEKLRQGHNIILISNHQTEADPAVIALLLETTNPHLAEKMTYIAGDRVVTDPLCKPFSIGRNLICVYSKKHMNDVPELAEMKRKANTRSLKEMAMLLRGGSQIIWIAPSGGRDRPDPVTDEWFPAPFDASALDNLRRLAEHSAAPGHIYPLALLCHDIMPPPRQVEKEIGEKRMIAFHGTGLSVAPEIPFSEIATSCKSPEEAKEAYTQALYNVVTEQYNVLKSAIHGKQGLKASTPNVSLSQTWI